MRQMPVLETERLVIRPFRPDDLEAVHQIFDLENPLTAWPLDVRRKWLEWNSLNPWGLSQVAQPPYGDRAVTLRDGALIGSVGVVPYLTQLAVLPSMGGIRNPRSQAEVGLFWEIAAAHRRRGYATEAARALIAHLFQEENLGRIIAETDPDNLASQGVMRSLGMRIERNPYPEPPWLQVVGILSNDL